MYLQNGNFIIKWDKNYNSFKMGQMRLMYLNELTVYLLLLLHV